MYEIQQRQECTSDLFGGPPAQCNLTPKLIHAHKHTHTQTRTHFCSVQYIFLILRCFARVMAGINRRHCSTFADAHNKKLGDQTYTHNTYCMCTQRQL